MILKNLFRRKGRTLLTILGIGIGVAAIVGLGALANGLESGYNSFLTGSKADLILSQPDSFDVSLSSVDAGIEKELLAMSEIKAVSGMLQGLVQTESVPYFFIFGYPEDSFILKRFQIVEGVGLDAREAQRSQGKPLLLGRSAAETLNKNVGDILRLTDRVFRVVGIYETGETLEDSGAVIRLRDAQDLLGRPHQVSIFYVQLKDPALRDRVLNRAGRLWPNLSLTSTSDYADKQMMGDVLRGYVWVIAGLAIIIGGFGMMNAQLMAVMERTREIGVLRSVGWSRGRVLRMILGESLLVGLLGGLTGILMGWGAISGFSNVARFFGATTANITLDLIEQAIIVVLLLGVIGGVYPAWRASRLLPVEALRYEGGSGGENAKRFPIGGMIVQSLWRRKARTLLTLVAIGVAVGGIVALEATVRGMAKTITAMSSDSEIMIRQEGIADTGYSVLDERIGEKIAIYPEVAYVSGMMFAAATMPEAGGFFILFGYAPNEYAIRNFNVIEGQRITGNRQIMLGKMMAEALKRGVGDTIELSGSRFKVVGIYEAGASWQELGGIATLRDVQNFSGKPHKVQLYMVKLHDPADAPEVVEKINSEMPDAHAALTGEFAEQMPDMQNTQGMMTGISFLAIIVGGVGVMNTMLMTVLERTREIGVLRALGWKRSRILGMILREALLLGLLGGALGILLAFGMTAAMAKAPMVGDMLKPLWETDIFVRAIAVALMLGLLGGIYPAARATRLQPVEALRYE